MTSESPWILGLEPSPRSAGAIAFARWLRVALHARVVGVHVSEFWVFGRSPGEGAAYVRAARAETERWLAALVEDGGVDAAEVREALDAETALAEVGRGATAIVVGRRNADERPWVRLGRVARRLLRSLPAPVIVVPPELASTDQGGPVLLASDLGETSVAAARFAAAFARRAGRSLVCVHVGQEDALAESTPQWLARRRDDRETLARTARSWVLAHCPAASLVLEFGSPEEVLPALAEHRRASLLVVGSRRVDLTERVFAGSVASVVASAAHCVVAVVPPDAEASLS